MSQDKTKLEIEESLRKQIEEISFIVNGLDGYEPYLQAIKRFRDTREMIDNNWHLIMDIQKLSEVRLSKMAANSIINYVDDLKFDLDRLQNEMIVLRNPDLIINKDYDPN